MSSWTNVEMFKMLHMFVDKIEVQADGTAKVHYRFKEPTGPSA